MTEQPTQNPPCDFISRYGQQCVMERGHDGGHITPELRLSAHIAKAIFDAPYGYGKDKVQRIAMKGGQYPDHETDMGGMCFNALMEVIEAALQERGLA